MARLKPAEGYCLVELRGYQNIAVPEGKYNRHTEGICVDGEYKGKRVFWEEFQASGIIEQDGKKYSFIKTEDVRGYETSQKIN